MSSSWSNVTLHGSDFVPLIFDEATASSKTNDGSDGNTQQKNWGPFVIEGQLYVTYSIEPLRVLRVDMQTGRCTEVSSVSSPILSPMAHMLRGGSQSVFLPQENAFLGCARVVHNTMFSHVFYTFSASAPFRVLKVSSSEWCFARRAKLEGAKSYECEHIQFVSGLAVRNDDKELILTFGVNDCESRLTTLLVADVLESLLPITHSNVVDAFKKANPGLV